MSFAICTIINNNAFSFSIPEEMDYSAPFNFLSSGEGDSLAPNSLNDDNSTSPKMDDANLAGRVDSDIFLQHENEHLKNNDHTDYQYDKDLKIDNVISKMIEPESNNAKNESNSKLDFYKNKYQEKNDEFKSENIKKNSNIPISDGKIAVINFDDSWKSQYENAKAILDEYQFKSTYYVVCDYIDGKNRLTWKQVQTLQEEGNEIGSHSMNHVNLDQITRDSKYNEIVESKKCLEDRGLNINSFSYPFNSGDDDKESLDLVSNTYDFARTAGGDSHTGSDCVGSLKHDEKYTIVGWSHDAERKENNYSDLQMLDAFKAFVKQFSGKSHSVGSIPIIIYHNIDDDRGEYSTSIDLFRSEMRYLYDSGFKTVTMNEVFG